MPIDNPAGLALTKSFEKFVPFAYDDAIYPSVPYVSGTPLRGTLTIGYGHTGPDVKPGQVISESVADGLLQHDMWNAEQAIDAAVEVILTPNQYGALCDFVYNVGAGAFRSSTLLRILNEGDYAGAADCFGAWIWAGGVVNQGLVRRREAERALFLSK